MKNVYIVACFIAASILGACGSSDSPGYDKSLAPANATKAVTPLTIADTLLSDTTRPVAAAITTTTAAPGTVSINSAPAPVNITPTSRTTASSNQTGLNPAHGQPGHRCEIAVGAPLNSPAPAQAAAPAITAKPVVTTGAQPTPAASIGGGKLNPPHGQPGHDCAVQVGAPLKN